MNDSREYMDEMNYSPVPAHFVDRIACIGMRVTSYYDSVPNEFAKSDLDDFIHPYYCIAHMIDGNSGCYYSEDTRLEQKLSPGDLIISVPGEELKYGGTGPGSFVEDSICFTGPSADALFREGILSSGVVNIGRTRRLLPIIEKIREYNIDSHFEAILMLQQLLLEIFKIRREPNSADHSEVLTMLMKEITRDLSRWWTVSDMAAFCNVSENYLRRLFKKQVGMSPKEYVDTIKMNAATEFLFKFDTVNEVAKMLGYQDQYHFTRRFKNIRGVSPTKFRNDYRNSFNEGRSSQ